MRKYIDIIANTRLGFLLSKILISIEFNIMKLYHTEETMALLKQIITEDKPFLLKPSELFLIYSLAKHQVDVEGDFAEVGVFKGATAKAICEAKKDKHLYLFDTFEGLPETGEIDTMFKAKLFQSTVDTVNKKLSKYQNVHIYKGLFPETGREINNKKFAFVHIDVDLYQSTKDCLNFFYEKMPSKGILISHDYHAKGVKKAFNEYFQNKPEHVIELPMSQCMVIKK